MGMEAYGLNISIQENEWISVTYVSDLSHQIDHGVFYHSEEYYKGGRDFYRLHY